MQWRKKRTETPPMGNKIVLN